LLCVLAESNKSIVEVAKPFRMRNSTNHIMLPLGSVSPFSEERQLILVERLVDMVLACWNKLTVVNDFLQSSSIVNLHILPN